MRRSRDAASVTSLPQSPKVEGDSRTRHYLISMSIRMVCLGLAVFVTPYGWYTWVFALLAAVLPYIAVVNANAGSGRSVAKAESPTDALPAGPEESPKDPEPPTVITIRERTDEGEST